VSRSEPRSATSHGCWIPEESSYGGDYEDWRLLGCDALESGSSLPEYQERRVLFYHEYGASRFLWKSITVYQTIRCHISEDNNLQLILYLVLEREARFPNVTVISTSTWFRKPNIIHRRAFSGEITGSNPSWYAWHKPFLRRQLVTTNRLLSLIRHWPHRKDPSNNSSIVACVFVTAVTFLPNRCLATIGKFLPSRCLATIREFLPNCCLATIEDIQTHTQTATWSHKPTLFFKIRNVG
jgi:hypothetical protein